MLLPALPAFVGRVLVGLGVAAVTATLFSLVLDGRSWSEQFGIACLVVGALVLLMGLGGHSPSMRLGLQDQYLASFFPGLAGRLGDDYSKTRISDSAIFVVVALVLFVLGFALV